MINLFLINILLAIAWGAFTGSFAPLNLILGFLLSGAALWIIREQFGTTKYFNRGFLILGLAGLFVYELILSSLRVAREVLRPKFRFKSGIIALPLDLDKDFQIMLLANLITLTPGTLSVDVSTDKSTLYIHVMDVPDKQALIDTIKNGFERKIKQALE